MLKKNNRKKGKGWFVNEYNKIYVCGTVNGKFQRASTGLEATTGNIKFISHKQNARDKLLSLVSPMQQAKTDFETFGREAIKSGAKVQRADGSWTKKGRGATAQKNAETSFTKHLLPYFKKFSLQEINAFVVEDWQNKKLSEGYATDSVAKWRNYLSQIMDRAVKYELVTANKVELADTIEIVHKKTEGYTVEEARAMMDKATGLMKVWLPIAFNTGIRVGEQKALQVQDIDFEHKCIYIQRAVNQNIITFSSTTKNHNRIVYISDYTANLLKEYIEQNNLTLWLFPNNQGSFYKSSQTIDKYYLQPLLKELGIKKGTLGKTRKTFASIGKSYSMDETMRQQAMGHRAGSSVTDNHYTFPTMTQVQAQKGQEALAPINNVLFDINIKKV